MAIHSRNKGKKKLYNLEVALAMAKDKDGRHISWKPRKARIKATGGSVFIHPCCECGFDGSFGFPDNKWYCFKHKNKGIQHEGSTSNRAK